MGKMSRSNMNGELTAKLNQIVQPGSYYVDQDNGNDANDGRTPSTAWKTTTKVNEFLSNKVSSGIITVNLAKGSYGSIDINDLNCERLFIQGAGPDKTFIRSTINRTAAKLFSVTYVIFTNLTLTANTDSAEKATSLLNVNNSRFVELADSVNMNGSELDPSGSTAANLALVDAFYVRCKFLSLNTIHAISTVLNTRVSVSGASFDQAYHITINGGSTYSEWSYQEGSAVPIVLKDANSDFVNKTQQGIIVESGVNANGTYAKFADGTVIFSTWIHVMPPAGTAFPTNTIITTPCVTPVTVIYPYTVISQHGGSAFGHLKDYRVAWIDNSIYNIDIIVAEQLLPDQNFGFNVVSIGRWK